MKSPLKQLVKAISSGLGYEIRKTGHSFPSDPFEAQCLLIYGLGKSNVTILDVGANKGQTAKRYRAEFPNAEIYCFEPFPDAVDALQRNFSHDARIHILPTAVANESGHKIFYVNESNSSNSLLPRPVSGRRYYPQRAGPKGTIEVQVTTLDEFMTAHQISAIDILKFDIQGGELMALHGAQALLHTGDVSLIYTEVFFIPHYTGSPLFHEIWSFLADFGYSLFEIYDLHKAANGQVRYGNVLFVSESIRNDVINKVPEEP